jgi:hypothetical protein
MSQQQQVMLQGDNRGRHILIGIVLIALCAALLEAWRPGTLHTVASRIYNVLVQLFGYLRSLAHFLRELPKSISHWNR